MVHSAWRKHSIGFGLPETLQSVRNTSIKVQFCVALKANPDKFQSFGLAPARLTADFQFRADDKQLQQEKSMKLLGITIDDKLNFHEHIANLCRKTSRQISVLNRLKRLVPLDAKKKLYNSFILSHLNYCSTVWHFCLKRDSDKIEKLNERALRSLFQDRSSDYGTLLKKAGKTTLYTRRVQDIAILVYKLGFQKPSAHK